MGAWSLIVMLLTTPVLAQHPDRDMPIHEKFYSNWFMPDQPTKSCCNMSDCYPTQAKFENGHWLAQRREDGEWLVIPEKKMEQNRDNPDGRSHLCAPRPFATGDKVYCFTLGGGT